MSYGSSTRNGPGDWAGENNRRTRELLGNIRRMAIKLTSRATWQMIGHILLDGKPETQNVDVFPGVGFYARPKDSGRAEAIVVHPGGGAAHAVAVATRDMDSQKKATVGIKENETQMHNDQALVRCTAEGKVEARSIAGTAVELATKEDLQNLVDYIKNEMVIVTPSGNSTPGVAGSPSPQPPNPTGTTKFKAE